MPTTLGSTTVSRFEHSPEAHKLHIDFEVATGQTVHMADPVLLATNGDIQAAAAGASAETLIGVAMTDGVATERVTVSMKGYCEVHGENGFAGALNAGPVELGAWNATTGVREFIAASTAAKTIGHNLFQVAADGAAIRVVILL